MKQFITFLLLSTAVSACNSGGKPVKKNPRIAAAEQSEPERNSPEKSKATLPKEIRLKGKFLKETDDGMREYAVVLSVDGTGTTIDTIATCETITPQSYDQYDIPDAAVAACGGWWAGQGEYFYAVLEKGNVAVYYGWQDEAQEDKGFHWKKKK